MTTLYELTEELLFLLDLLREPEADPEAVQGSIEMVKGEFEVKLNGYGKVLKQIECEALCLDGEIIRLKKRKDALNNSAKRMKKVIEDSMIATGTRKVDTELFKFSIQKNPKKLVLADEIDFNAIDPEFLVFNDPSIDKAAVKEAIEKGAEFEWAKVVQEEGLRIR